MSCTVSRASSLLELPVLTALMVILHIHTKWSVITACSDAVGQLVFDDDFEIVLSSFVRAKNNWKTP